MTLRYNIFVRDLPDGDWKRLVDSPTSKEKADEILDDIENKIRHNNLKIEAAVTIDRMW